MASLRSRTTELATRDPKYDAALATNVRAMIRAANREAAT